jgi:hypothetical protein
VPRPEIGVSIERLAEANNGHGVHNFPEADLRGADDDVFPRVLGETVNALERALVPHVFMGGIASTTYGRPRWTHDIDVFVKPTDAERALSVLDAAGFETEKTDVTWLFKGFKENVMVDVIFKSTGGIHLDDEMVRRAVTTSFLGQTVRIIPPEDLLVVKAVVHDERGPRHWHDALGIISGTELDWDYLLHRARRAPRRVLSLLVYAQSIDMPVPNRVVRMLFDCVYDR